MDQLLTVSINLLWLLQQPHVLFSDPHVSSLPCLPTYSNLNVGHGHRWLCTGIQTPPCPWSVVGGRMDSHPIEHHLVI